MANYIDVFGSATLPPSEFKAQTLALTASASMFWPYNYSGTGIVIAKLNTLTSTGAYTLTFPDATEVSSGEDSLWVNTSAFTITLHDSTGSVITTIATGVSKYVWLKSNATAAGTWSTVTFGTGTSAADAAALAGYGTLATGATLSSAIPITESPLTITVDATTGRAQGYVFTGGSVPCTFPSAAAAGADFFFYVKNAGTGTITLTPVGGDLVDGVASLGLNPQESCTIVSSGTDWHTIGLGRSTIYQFTKLVKDLTGIASYAMSASDASNKLLQFTGAPSGATTITVPAVVAIYYVEISTSNAYTVLLKTAAGTGVTLSTAERSILYCDGVNVVSAQTASAPSSSTTITNDTTTNATMYPVWVTNTTGDLPEYVSSTKLYFNPSTGMLTVTGITSTLTGAASAVVVADAAGDTTTFPMLATDATGSLAPKTDAGLSYNATTNVLTAGGIAAALSGASLAANTWTGEQFFVETKDTVYNITDGAAFEIDPANGNIQTITLGASRTPKATNFAAGQCILLGIDDGSAYTITWTDGTLSPVWVKSGGAATAPTLATTGYTWILLWKVSTTIYGTLVGSP